MANQNKPEYITPKMYASAYCPPDKVFMLPTGLMGGFKPPEMPEPSWRIGRRPMEILMDDIDDDGFKEKADAMIKAHKEKKIKNECEIPNCKWCQQKLDEAEWKTIFKPTNPERAKRTTTTRTKKPKTRHAKAEKKILDHMSDLLKENISAPLLDLDQEDVHLEAMFVTAKTMQAFR